MFGLGVNRLGRLNSSTQAFSPASLFNNGEAGVWYDPSAASGSLDWRKNLLEYTESFGNSYWYKQNSTITPNATPAPDGSTTAETLMQYIKQLINILLYFGAKALADDDGGSSAYNGEGPTNPGGN